MATETLNDPMGQAILDFARDGKAGDIVVSSDICDDDIIPVLYLFRNYEAMPELEKIALKQCSGKVLDVGAGAGIHAAYLLENGYQVDAIDISTGSVEHMKRIGIPAAQRNFFDITEGNYNTLLMLMNGIGIAGTLENLDATLIHAKKLVNEGGKIICDSSDIKYLYQDDDGSYWMDLNSTYYGNFNFQMKYKNHQTNWFEWLYVDFEKLQESAKRTGWNARKLYDSEDHYLAELTLI